MLIASFCHNDDDRSLRNVKWDDTMHKENYKKIFSFFSAVVETKKYLHKIKNSLSQILFQIWNKVTDQFNKFLVLQIRSFTEIDMGLTHISEGLR